MSETMGGDEGRGPEGFGAPADTNPFDFRLNRVDVSMNRVDLSHPLSTVTPTWPGEPPVKFEGWSSVERDGHYLRRISLGEHTGTHLTAPATFFAGGKTVDQYRPEELVHGAVVIDVRHRCKNDRDYGLTGLRPAGVGVPTRDGTGGLLSTVSHGVVRALGRPGGLLRCRLRRGPSFSGLWPGCGRGAGGGTQSCRPGDRHGRGGTGERRRLFRQQDLLVGRADCLGKPGQPGIIGIEGG